MPKHTRAQFLVANHRSPPPPPSATTASNTTPTTTTTIELGVVSQHMKGLFFARREDGRLYVAVTTHNPATLNANNEVLEEHTMGTATSTEGTPWT
jgi:hypothetical protein